MVLWKIECYFSHSIGSCLDDRWILAKADLDAKRCWLFLVVGVFFSWLWFFLATLTLALPLLRASFGLEQIRCPENLGKSPWMKLGKMAPRRSNTRLGAEAKLTLYRVSRRNSNADADAKHWTKERDSLEHTVATKTRTFFVRFDSKPFWIYELSFWVVCRQIQVVFMVMKLLSSPLVFVLCIHVGKGVMVIS